MRNNWGIDAYIHRPEHDNSVNLSQHMSVNHLVSHIRHELPALMFRGKVLRLEPWPIWKFCPQYQHGLIWSKIIGLKIKVTVSIISNQGPCSIQDQIINWNISTKRITLAIQVAFRLPYVMSTYRSLKNKNFKDGIDNRIRLHIPI